MVLADGESNSGGDWRGGWMSRVIPALRWVGAFETREEMQRACGLAKNTKVDAPHNEGEA